MSVMFLMEAAKKADLAFGVPPRSTAHTVASAVGDIEKMANHLMEKRAVHSLDDRTTPVFQDPTNTGWAKFTSAWLRDTLHRTSTDDLQESQTEVEEELDITDAEYSLADIT